MSTAGCAQEEEEEEEEELYTIDVSLEKVIRLVYTFIECVLYDALLIGKIELCTCRLLFIIYSFKRTVFQNDGGRHEQRRFLARRHSQGKCQYMHSPALTYIAHTCGTGVCELKLTICMCKFFFSFSIRL